MFVADCAWYNNSETLRLAINYVIDKGAIVVSSVGNDGNSKVYYPAGYESVIGGGTSFSTPYVSGIIADIMSVKQDITVQDIKEILKETSEDLGEEGYDTSYGYGLIRADNIVDYLLKDNTCFTSGIDQSETDGKYEIRFRLKDTSFVPAFLLAEYTDGTGAQSWVHVVGNTLSQEAFLTEGALKCDVASSLSNGSLYIAVPGVNAIGLLPDTLNQLNVRKIYEVFDMDKLTNGNVKKALIKVKSMLISRGIEVQSCTWNAEYKGIDDYYLFRRNFYEQQSVA